MNVNNSIAERSEGQECLSAGNSPGDVSLSRADRRILLSAALRELLNRYSKGKAIYSRELAFLVSLGDGDNPSAGDITVGAA